MTSSRHLRIGISHDPIRFEATYVVTMSDLEHRGQWATFYSSGCFVKYYFLKYIKLILFKIYF